MIKNIAELLQAFKKMKQLNWIWIKPWTNNWWYVKGYLSIKPSNSPQPNLKIVEGFVTDGKQFLSGQIDCILGS